MDALDDSGSSKHGGYEEKEARRKRREKRLLKAGRTGAGLGNGVKRTEANLECVSDRSLYHQRN